MAKHPKIDKMQMQLLRYNMHVCGAYEAVQERESAFEMIQRTMGEVINDLDEKQDHENKYKLHTVMQVMELLNRDALRIAEEGLQVIKLGNEED